MTTRNTTFNLSIPKGLKEKARVQARKRHFSSTSDYLQHLIRSDVELAEHKQELNAFLQAGLASGEAKPMSLDTLSIWMQDVIKKS